MIPNWAGDVPRGTLSRLETYAAVLTKWNQKINLIAQGEDFWARHIWDSYQLVSLIPTSTKTIADLGSGGGLPGLVIACATEIPITLIERDQRKAVFLREAARTVGLDHVTIVAKGVEEVGETFDLITARALAPLTFLFGLAQPLMGKTSTCLFPKGENFASELEDAGRHWHFKHRVIPSKTHEKACIISVTELSTRAG